MVRHTYRCYNKKSRSYKYYGLRGIKVCDRWSIFENFLTDMGEKPLGYDIDRIDTIGDYSPENCRYTTREINANNKRNKRFVKIILENNNYEIGRIKYLSKKYNVLRSGIHNVLSGRYKTSNGYKFEYITHDPTSTNKET